MFCRNCGTTVEAGTAFCGNCGTPVEQSGSSVATAVSDPTGGGMPSIDLSPGASADDTLLAMTKEHLGKDYRIDKELGRGGMAVVYKGVEIALERTVAIKVVPPDSANSSQAAERFKREAKLAASLDHPNIIPVYRVGQAGPLHFMAMKFVEGRAVDSVIEQQGALPLSVCVAILKFSALGLAFAHERKIVHRDIKPANILVDKDGRVMVSDFGIARALEEASMTASGMMIGTPYYMSPEQCGGQKVSPQSDQYSLGIMGFQMLTGEVPFLAESMVGVIQHHYMTPVPDILNVRQDVPKELLDVIYCALNKDPLDRFATTKDMATGLENIPLSDKDFAEAETLLRQLSAGQPIPKVRTGTLPPLSLTISGPGPRVAARPATAPKPRTAPQIAVQPKKKKKKKNKAVLAAMLMGTVVFLGGGGYAFKVDQDAKRAQADRARAEQTRLAALADSLRQGSKVVYGLPEVAGQPPVLATIDGRAYGNGDRFTADTGRYTVTAQATGYSPYQGTVSIESGRHDSLQIQMALAVVAAPQNQRPGSAPTIVRDSGEIRARVQPPYADILIDGNKVATGVYFKRIPAGQHTIRFSAQGCIGRDTTINMTKGETVVVQMRLTGGNCGQ